MSQNLSMLQAVVSGLVVNGWRLHCRREKINQITIPNMQLMSSEVVRPIANPISRLVMANWKCAMAGY